VAHGGSDPTTRLYTRGGDAGETGLVGGARVRKDSQRIRTYGSFDELASHLGLAEALLPSSSRSERELLRRLQHELFTAMTELATPLSRAPTHTLAQRHVDRLEHDIDRLQVTTPPLTSFVLPGGTVGASELHVARTVARRAERELVALNQLEPVRPELLRWTNRLSDLLFALARAANHEAHEPETAPDYSV
jgi:cob(I)alamin adenosyltransferase